MCVFCSWLIVANDWIEAWRLFTPTVLRHVIVWSEYHELHLLKMASDYKENCGKKQQQTNKTQPASYITVELVQETGVLLWTKPSYLASSLSLSLVLQSCLEVNLPHSSPEHFSKMRKELWKFHPCNKLGIYYNSVKTKQWGMWS